MEDLNSKNRNKKILKMFFVHETSRRQQKD